MGWDEGEDRSQSLYVQRRRKSYLAGREPKDERQRDGACCCWKLQKYGLQGQPLSVSSMETWSLRLFSFSLVVEVFPCLRMDMECS